MIVEPSVKYTGNVKKAERLLGYGQHTMRVLENLMEFQGLDQYSISMSPYPGAVITCTKTFGIKKIVIDVPIVHEFDLKCTKECFCNWNFSFGWVLEVKSKKLQGKVPMYDLMICHNKSFFILVKDVLATDFTKYEQYQQVLVMPYNGMKFDNKDTLHGDPRGCAPRVSDLPTENSAWRTTVRILPWCAISLERYFNNENTFMRSQK